MRVVTAKESGRMCRMHLRLAVFCQVCIFGRVPKQFPQNCTVLRGDSYGHRWHLECADRCPHCFPDEWVKPHSIVACEAQVVETSTNSSATGIFVQSVYPSGVCVSLSPQNIPMRNSEFERFSSYAPVVYPFRTLCEPELRHAAEFMRTDPVLQSIKSLADSVCEQCFRMTNCVAVGHALQRVVPHGDLFGCSLVHQIRSMCCFSVTGHAQQGRMQGITHYLATAGQCQALSRDERNFSVTCRNNFDTIALHGVQGLLVLFCDAHRVDALDHRVCICGVSPVVTPQSNFMECPKRMRNRERRMSSQTLLCGA